MAPARLPMTYAALPRLRSLWELIIPSPAPLSMNPTVLTRLRAPQGLVIPPIAPLSIACITCLRPQIPWYLMSLPRKRRLVRSRILHVPGYSIRGRIRTALVGSRGGKDPLGSGSWSCSLPLGKRARFRVLSHSPLQRAFEIIPLACDL